MGVFRRWRASTALVPPALSSWTAEGLPPAKLLDCKRNCSRKAQAVLLFSLPRNKRLVTDGPRIHEPGTEVTSVLREVCALWNSGAWEGIACRFGLLTSNVDTRRNCRTPVPDSIPVRAAEKIACTKHSASVRGTSPSRGQQLSAVTHPWQGR